MSLEFCLYIMIYESQYVYLCLPAVRLVPFWQISHDALIQAGAITPLYIIIFFKSIYRTWLLLFEVPRVLVMHVDHKWLQYKWQGSHVWKTGKMKNVRQKSGNLILAKMEFREFVLEMASLPQNDVIFWQFPWFFNTKTISCVKSSKLIVMTCQWTWFSIMDETINTMKL